MGRCERFIETFGQQIETSPPMKPQGWLTTSVSIDDREFVVRLFTDVATVDDGEMTLMSEVLYDPEWDEETILDSLAGCFGPADREAFDNEYRSRLLTAGLIEDD